MAWQMGPAGPDSVGSAALIALGIRQAGEPILAQPCPPFELPREAAEARRLLRELRARMGRVAALQPFSKGIGLAAPQIGVARAAALVLTPGGGRPLALLNPRVVDRSDREDEQYEGCLSFFDVRGLVQRPLWIELTHQDLDGRERRARLERGAARLAAHELDHLRGVLYTERMAPGRKPIPLALYRGTGTPWVYDEGAT